MPLPMYPAIVDANFFRETLLDQSLTLSYVPQVDGVFLTDNRKFLALSARNSPLNSLLAAQQLTAQGSYSRVPMVTGDCLDEGTFFSLTSANTTTDAQALAYIKANYVPKITDSELAELAGQYPSDPNVGSPYETGLRNQLTPQFKRRGLLCSSFLLGAIGY